jgi:hypothetical protein
MGVMGLSKIADFEFLEKWSDRTAPNLTFGSLWKL